MTSDVTLSTFQTFGRTHFRKAEETQNLEASRLCAPSRILDTGKHDVPELDLLSSSDERRETAAVLGPIERAAFNHWTACALISNCQL
jgi:hypothetical protein